MKESILHKVRRCKCGTTYYVNVDGDEFQCDGCIAADEIQDRVADDNVAEFGWREGVKLTEDGAIE